MCHIMHISDFVRTALKMDLPAELFGQRTCKASCAASSKEDVCARALHLHVGIDFPSRHHFYEYRFQIPRTYPHLLHPLCLSVLIMNNANTNRKLFRGVVSCNATHPFARRNRTVLQHRTKRACFRISFSDIRSTSNEIIFQIKQRPHS